MAAGRLSTPLVAAGAACWQQAVCSQHCLAWGHWGLWGHPGRGGSEIKAAGKGRRIREWKEGSYNEQGEKEIGKSCNARHEKVNRK